MKWSLANTDLFLTFLLFLLPVIVACSGAELHSEYQDDYQPMTAYIQPDLADDGIAEPLVHITVPIRNLVFSRNNGTISGGLEVVVVAWRGEDQVGGAVASESLHFSRWSETQSDSLLTVDVGVSLDSAEEVVLEVRARSLGTSRSWVKRIPCHPDQWRRLPLIFTDWFWNADSDGVLDQGAKVLKVDLFTGRVSDVKWPKGGMCQELVITGKDGIKHVDTIGLALLDTLNSPGLQQHTLTLEYLPFGRYQALARLVSEIGTENEVVSSWYPARDLLVTWINFLNDEAWSLQLEWLDGLCSEDKLVFLEGLDGSARQEQWAELWQSKSMGSRDEMEHLLTILATDQRFDGPQRGALTDQGRAWIRYGAPDHIQHKGNMSGRYRRWEIWQYRDLGMNLTFLDAHGLGEYRLIQTDFPTD